MRSGSAPTRAARPTASAPGCKASAAPAWCCAIGDATPGQGAARGARNARKPACRPTARICTLAIRRLHKGVAYDLELDTSRLMPAECARLIQQRFKL
ncbi:phosphotransferase-like protein [Mesorhizobium sp. CA4]|uniref:phosphotransferase-like protein n=1 Tax=Mesorhizobium sp. CA4 TaxID=588499 RepID=UPI001CD0FC17|nr:hypothetical protein [Mesorhizobium sp. CA4]MBZ9818733.1 hypothetical protein [Mesorhizobium sp. CA4]